MDISSLVYIPWSAFSAMIKLYLIQSLSKKYDWRMCVWCSRVSAAELDWNSDHSHTIFPMEGKQYPKGVPLTGTRKMKFL